jgi:hypothetical protein
MTAQKGIASRPPQDGAEQSGEVSLFGLPLLLEGEDPEAYDRLFARINVAIQPSDFIEEIWITDIADLTWEILRLRRQKTSIMNERIQSEIENFIQNRIRRREPEVDSIGSFWTTKRNSRAASKLVKGWTAQDPAAIRRVEKLMAAANISTDTVSGRALEAKLNTVERIERLIAVKEARRNAVLREIDRHRDFVAGMLQNGVREIEDAEFTAIEPKEIAMREEGSTQDHD